MQIGDRIPEILGVDQNGQEIKAAGFCNGRSTNGWSDWKDKENNSLSMVHRNK